MNKNDKQFELQKINPNFKILQIFNLLWHLKHYPSICILQVYAT